jgi:maleylacetoacetate isomerase
MIQLHNYFRSSASFRVRIALNLKGLDFEYLPVHLARGDHKRAAYTAISPDGLVPLLEIDGVKLTQSLAIMEYLDETRAKQPLLPADALGKAQVRALSQSIACEIHPLNNLRILKYLSTELAVSETAKTQWYVHWCRTGLEAFERQLALLPAAGSARAGGASGSGAFCYGNTPTMADCCLVPQIFNARRFDTPLDGLPRTMAAFDACMALPAFDKAQPKHCPDAE